MSNTLDAKTMYNIELVNGITLHSYVYEDCSLFDIHYSVDGDEYVIESLHYDVHPTMASIDHVIVTSVTHVDEDGDTIGVLSFSDMTAMQEHYDILADYIHNKLLEDCGGYA